MTTCHPRSDPTQFLSLFLVFFFVLVFFSPLFSFSFLSAVLILLSIASRFLWKTMGLRGSEVVRQHLRYEVIGWARVGRFLKWAFEWHAEDEHLATIVEEMGKSMENVSRCGTEKCAPVD